MNVLVSEAAAAAAAGGLVAGADVTRCRRCCCCCLLSDAADTATAAASTVAGVVSVWHSSLRSRALYSSIATVTAATTSDRRSQTSADHSAATWRTQLTQYSCGINDPRQSLWIPGPYPGHQHNVSGWSLGHSPPLGKISTNSVLNLLIYTASVSLPPIS